VVFETTAYAVPPLRQDQSEYRPRPAGRQVWYAASFTLHLDVGFVGQRQG
jgi:hypothetical protein